jgi:hypothetical protein
MPKNPKAKFRKNDILLHKEQNKVFIIDNRILVNNKNWLYTLKTVSNNSSNAEYKRYYESKVEEKCKKIKNIKTAKVLYGNGKN